MRVAARADDLPLRRAVLLLGLLLMLVAPLSAADAGEGPEAFLRGFAAEGLAVLRDGKLAQEDRRTMFRRLLQDHFDLALIGRFVLGKHWRRMPPGQRELYLAHFEDYVVALTTRRLARFTDETIELGRARPTGKADMVVASRIIRSEGAAVRLDWRLRPYGGDWRIIDVVVEGVSQALTQRNEFDAVIRSSDGGVDHLLKRLREQTRRLQATES